MPVPRPTSRISTASAVLGTRPAATTTNRTYLVMDKTPAAKPPAPALLPRQVDILDYLYQEEQTQGEAGVMVKIPARPTATRPYTMYMDARLLAAGGLVTLETETTVRITRAPHESMPWHYDWIVRLAPAGRLLIQKSIARAASRKLPGRTTAEKVRRPVPDPSVGRDAPAPAPAAAPVPAPRRAKPKPATPPPAPPAPPAPAVPSPRPKPEKTTPAPADPPVDPPTEFEFS